MMEKTLLKEAGNTVLLKKDFDRLSELIHKEAGIKMPPIKKTMLETRLRKRMRVLEIDDFEKYCRYLFSQNGLESELPHMIDVVTTNKTDFFREPDQFMYLTEYALPSLLNIRGTGIEYPLKIWSAGCSSGEEPYTIAMVAAEFSEAVPGYNFSITASDISSIVLEKAVLGVYDIERVEPVPLPLKKKYLLRSKDRNKQLVRIAPGLRHKISFKRINFMSQNFDMGGTFDIIFCRNVIIYFDRETQEKLIMKLFNHLNPKGYLFLGHSETILNMKIPMVQTAPSIYMKD